MAEYISFQPSDYFNTLLYTGTGATVSRTGVGFKPDMIWGKGRNTTYQHQLYDSVRGTTKMIEPSTDNAEATETGGVTAFGSDGFTTGNNTEINENTKTFVVWNWKAGTTTGIATNGSTTITPSSYSFNQTSDMSILQYTGNSTSGAKLAHGLGAVPKMVFVKSTSHSGDAWAVYHASVGNTKYGTLDSNATWTTSSTRWNDTDPDSVNFTLGNSGAVNNSAKTYIAYCFADVKGYSKFGSYIGTTDENADAAFCYCGFSPAWILIKANYASKPWMIFDNKREGYNPDNDVLLANSTAVETTTDYIDILSNGFKIRSTSTDINQDDVSYIWTAFAEFPIVSSNDTPGLAR